MADRYRDLVNSGPGAFVARRVGLPRPARLRRYAPGDPLLPGPLLTVGTGRLGGVIGSALPDVTAAGPDDRPAAIIVDATGLAGPADLAGLRASLQPVVRRLRSSGRVVVLADPPDGAPDVAAAAARQAVEGFVRSLAKELRAGATANLVRVPVGAAALVAGPLRFFLSGRSAYVDGQVVTLGPGRPATTPDGRPLDGRVAVVTGAARGIGAAIARVLARDGALVVAVDVPAAGEALAAVANEIGGTALQLDITATDAGSRLVRHLASRHGGVDIVVHNAGVTRDKLLANMDEARWDTVLAVNLQAQLDLTRAVLDAEGLLRDGGRVVCVSSQSGIAGNRGQTNYAASKAGVIGMVRAWAPEFADRGASINAVAPGFIVTDMTARMPFGPREVGARLNSLLQGGLPVDVAETIAWLAQAGSSGVNGQVVRVCGQSLIGA